MSDCSQREAKVIAGATGGFAVELRGRLIASVTFTCPDFDALQELLRWWLTLEDASLVDRGRSAPGVTAQERQLLRVPLEDCPKCKGNGVWTDSNWDDQCVQLCHCVLGEK